MSRKIKFLLVFILFTSNTKIKAQDYTMFWNAYQLLNPASVGVQQKINVAIICKEQFVGIKGAPIYLNGTSNVKLDAIHGGAGISYNHSKIGFTNTNGVNLDYSYHINLNNNRIIGLGISGGLSYQKTDVSNFIIPPIGGSDPLLQLNDKVYLLNYRFGFYYSSNHLELGISSSHYKSIDYEHITININNRAWIMGSYRFGIGEILDISPKVLIDASELKYNSLSTVLIVTYKKILWTGVSYNPSNYYGLMAGIDIMNMIRIGCSFERSSSALHNYSNGNYEIVLALRIK
jgi:type IX secretion system PorP/SprF family membrane protein